MADITIAWNRCSFEPAVLVPIVLVCLLYDLGALRWPVPNAAQIGDAYALVARGALDQFPVAWNHPFVPARAATRQTHTGSSGRSSVT